jgi:hypothetical protein
MEWHLITGEYPPQPGGVSDYTYLVASGLAAAGDVVHVWCPTCEKSCAEVPGVTVHRELGGMRPQDLLHVSRMLDKYSQPRRLLVQWVPHAFGFRSANLPLSYWVWNRASAHNDRVEVMIHEPCLPLPQDRLRHTALAVVHRIMLAMVLRAAARIWIAIPKWEERCRPYTARSVPFTWLPVISNIPVNRRPDATEAVRAQYARPGQHLIGHFGTCGGAIGRTLRAVLPELLNGHADRAVLLIGEDGKEIRDAILQQRPQFRDQLYLTGSLSAEQVSSHISACDMMLQPYPDGASSRRGSLMAAISHGRPVVTTAGPLTEPLWHSSSAVLLVPAGDDSEMIAAAENLLMNSSERLRLSRQARDFYNRQFDLRNIISNLRNQNHSFTDAVGITSKDTVNASSTGT